MVTSAARRVIAGLRRLFLVKFASGALVVAASLCGAPVHGQQDVVLVSNMDQRTDARPEVGRESNDPVFKALNQRGTQVFTTGSESNGYKLSSVVVILQGYEEHEAPYVRASLHLRSDTYTLERGRIGKKILEFANPTNYGARIAPGDIGVTPGVFVPAPGTPEESRILLPNTAYILNFNILNEFRVIREPALHYEGTWHVRNRVR